MSKTPPRYTCPARYCAEQICVVNLRLAAMDGVGCLSRSYLYILNKPARLSTSCDMSDIFDENC